MKKIFVIQNVKTKEYYFQRRCDEGFTPDIREASEFESKEAAESELTLQDDWKTDLFKGLWVEIKEYIKITQ